MQNKLRRSGAEIFLNARIWDKLLHINLLEDKVELTDAEIETMGQIQMKGWNVSPIYIAYLNAFFFNC